MKLTSPLLFFASLSQTAYGFLLTSSHRSLSEYGFARVNYGNDNVYTGFYDTGSYLSLTLDAKGIASSTSDLGNLLLKKVASDNSGVWLVTFTITSTPTSKDIRGPFAIKEGNFIYKGEGGGNWFICGNPGKYRLYFSKKKIANPDCFSAVLTVASF